MIDNTLFLADKTPIDCDKGFFASPSVNFGKSLPELSSGEDVYVTFTLTQPLVLKAASSISVAMYGSESTGLKDLIAGVSFNAKDYCVEAIKALSEKAKNIIDSFKDAKDDAKDALSKNIAIISSNIKTFQLLSENNKNAVTVDSDSTTIDNGTSFTVKLGHLHSLPYKSFSVVVASPEEAQITGEITAYLSLTPPFTNHIYQAANSLFMSEIKMEAEVETTKEKAKAKVKKTKEEAPKIESGDDL